jgi:hypothetical protein
MARGGDWDRFAGGREHVGIKDAVPAEQPTVVDGKWQLETHWELDAVRPGVAKYKSTFRKTICEPALE